MNPAFYRLIFMERPDFFVHETLENAPKWEETFGIWRSVMEDAIRAGNIRPDDPLKTSDAIWSMLHGIVALANRMPDFTLERYSALPVFFDDPVWGAEMTRGLRLAGLPER